MGRSELLKFKIQTLLIVLLLATFGLISCKSRLEEAGSNHSTELPNSQVREEQQENNIPEEQQENSNLSITSGSGWITRSNKPEDLPPDTALEVTGGGYSVEKQRIILEFGARYVQMALDEPLVDGKNINFSVERITLYYLDDYDQGAYPSLRTKLPGVFRIRVSEAYGKLKKNGDQITGNVTVNGSFELGKEIAQSGSLDAVFNLMAVPGNPSIFELPLDKGSDYEMGSHEQDVSTCFNCEEKPFFDLLLSNFLAVYKFNNFSWVLASFYSKPIEFTFLKLLRSPELNHKIIHSLEELKGMNTSMGPESGELACAWAFNQIIRHAGLKQLGEKPEFVPDIEQDLSQGRGVRIPKWRAQAGDIAIAPDANHIGICTSDGCKSIHSNSSSRKTFSWISDSSFDGQFSSSEIRVYRLLN